MDPTLAQTNPTPPPPQHSSSSSYTSFPILAISILGILTTSIFLVSYYVFVIKCCLNLRRSDLLLLRLSRSRRHLRHPNPPPLHSPNSRGLDPSSIRSIPTFRFTKTTRNSDVECAVCLTDFQESELLRLLPNCSHAFHIDCIDTWLQSHANCPLCRSNITITLPIHHFSTPEPSERDVVLIDIGSGDQTPTRPTPKSTSKVGRKFWHVTSMGDEWIDTRGKDERFVVQPIRRSFSMDSSNDRQLCVSVQEIWQQQHPNIYRELGNGEASSSGGSGRIRRSFFSFGRSAWSTALIPLQSD